MTWIPRHLDIEPLLTRRSVFLFGPRQTGKSTYVRRQLGATVTQTFSLLDQGLLTSVLADPTRIRQEIEARDLRDTVVCIDEIQKCPPLMDEVHLMIEERGIRFLLTGSSARALKRAGVNMLGGRGSDRVMHPFSWFELRDRFSLDRALNHGLLPPHYLSDDPDEGLASYVDRYLTEEIAAEGLARNLPGFARFLQTAAVTNARLLNYSNVARDAQVPRQTVVQWYAVLCDTLVAFELPAWSRTVRRTAIETAKFYFFDTGVVRALRRLPPVAEASADFGELFEHYVFLELRAWIDYPPAAHSARALALAGRPRGRLHPRRPGRDRGQGRAPRSAQAPAGAAGPRRGGARRPLDRRLPGRPPPPGTGHRGLADRVLPGGAVGEPVVRRHDSPMHLRTTADASPS